MNAPSTTDGTTGYAPGMTVVERYRLVEPAGEGAMGTVWRAEHTSLGHAVAIKFLHGSVANAAEPRARFEREARLAARLGEASRHITRVSDHGVLPDGTPFLVMEFLHGEGLEVRLKRERRLPIALVAKITSQLAKALHVAHAAGVIHRDLKPANVFLCASAEDAGLFVKLLDFGVAKATLETEENQATRQGALIGTPNYMSPEQITGHPVDARSDLFGLGGIVYRMAVGKAPFGSGALSELAMRIVATEPATPTSQAPDLPAEFDLFIKKALAKKPEDRFQNARDLADSLLMVAGVSATGSTGSFSATAAERLALQFGDSVGGVQQTLGHAGAAPAAPIVTRRSKAPLVLAAVLALMVGAVAFLSTRGATPPASATNAPTNATTSAPSNASASAGPPMTGTSASTATDASPPPTTTAASAPSPSVPSDPSKGKATPHVASKPTAQAANPTATGQPAATTVVPSPQPATTATVAPAAEPAQKPGDLWKKKDEM